MDSKRLKHIVKLIGILSILYLIISIPMLFMAWNLLLAVIPLVLALLLKKISESNSKKPVKTVVLAVFWLLFFPNAPYIITDFIHISELNFFARENYYGPAAYRMNITVWLRLVDICIGVVLGIVIGMLSLYIIHQLIIKKRGKKLAAAAVGAVCLLSGCAIYVGRFLRLNSWDIIRPIYLLSRFFESINLFFVLFSCLFAVFTAFLYFLFYTFYHKEVND